MPKPCIENTLSTGSLGISSTSLSSNSNASSSINDFTSSKPVPLVEDTGIIGAPSKKVSFISSFISSLTNSNHSSSTKSDLVITTNPFSIPTRSNMAKCSLVCGITPSSAATTNITISIPTTPASIFFMNFSCPGTSIIPALFPLGKSK